MPIRPERPRRIAAVLVGVALLHGLALWMLTRRPPAPTATPRTAVSLRIVVPVPPRRVDPPPAEPPAATAAQRTDRATPRRAAPPAAAAPEPTAEPQPVGPQAITVAPPAPPASTPEPPLNLDLPRRASAGLAPRNPALGDPRANTPQRGFGEGLAAALGSDERRVEEARGEGRLRIRQGRDCVDVRVARNTGLDPFNQSIRPSPKLVEPCP